MFLVNVHVRVKPEAVEDFKRIVTENARNSVMEAGIVRFDIIQQTDDPTRFILVEVYRSEEATIKHKQTGHYARWRDQAVGMMAEPRTSVRYNCLFPEETQWEYPQPMR